MPSPIERDRAPADQASLCRPPVFGGHPRQVEPGPAAYDDGAQRQQHDRNPLQQPLVFRAVALLERGADGCLAEPVDGAVVAEPRRHANAQGVGLSAVAHIELEANLAPLDRRLDTVDQCQPALGLHSHFRFQTRRIEAVEGQVDGLHKVVPHIGDHAADGAGDAGKARDQRGADAHLAHQGAAVQRAAAAERHQGEAAGIMPALDRYEADCAGHPRVGDPNDGLGRSDRIEPERLADLHCDCFAGRRHIEAFQAAADRPLRVDAAEHDVGVRDGRARAASAIAHRARVGARRLRSDLQ